MPRRLTLVIHALNTGGAERVMAMLANGWVDRGHQVTLITLDDVATDAFVLDPRVARVGLGLMGQSHSRWQAVGNNLTRLRRLRQAIRQADGDCVVVFTDKLNVLASLACWGTRQRLILSERSDPRHQRMSPGWERLRRWLYPRAAALVVQTQGVADYVSATWMRGRPVFVIANAVNSPTQDVGGNPSGPPRVVGVGRLSHEKGFDLLLDAFSRIAGRHPDWHLRIIGDGPRRADLEQLAADRGLSDRIEFTGWLPQPLDAVRDCGLFVLPSRYEGFPNALLEAMSCGLPAVSFACDSGPEEIIRPGIDGWLVPREDVDQLASTMDLAMSDAATRRKLGLRAREVRTRFGPHDFFRRWEQVLEQVTGQ